MPPPNTRASSLPRTCGAVFHKGLGEGEGTKLRSSRPKGPRGSRRGREMITSRTRPKPNHHSTGSSRAGCALGPHSNTIRMDSKGEDAEVVERQGRAQRVDRFEGLGLRLSDLSKDAGHLALEAKVVVSRDPLPCTAASEDPMPARSRS